MFWLKVVDFSPSHSLTSCCFSLLFYIYITCVCVCARVYEHMCLSHRKNYRQPVENTDTNTDTHIHRGALVSLLINHHVSWSCQKTLQENYNNMAWPQYCTRTAVFYFSVLANFYIVRASVLNGFNNLKVMVMPFFYPTTLLLYFKEHCGSVLVKFEFLDTALPLFSMGLFALPF